MHDHEHCGCGCHHHEHAHDENKIQTALGKYELAVDDAKVQAAVRQLIAEKVPQNDTLEVKKFLMGSIELTTLKTTDSEESVLAFTERVNQYDAQFPDLPHLATICAIPASPRPSARRSRSMVLKWPVSQVVSPHRKPSSR